MALLSDFAVVNVCRLLSPMSSVAQLLPVRSCGAKLTLPAAKHLRLSFHEEYSMGHNGLQHTRPVSASARQEGRLDARPRRGPNSRSPYGRTSKLPYANLICCRSQPEGALPRVGSVEEHRYAVANLSSL